MSYFDRFDICEAHYIFAMLWHDGKYTKTYGKFAQLSRLGFKPRPGLNEPEDLEENGLEIYEALIKRT